MGETTFITPDVDTSHENDGNAEYEARMIAKAEGKEPEPKLFAGKYKSEEDLTKGVLELIKMQNGGDLEAFYLATQKTVGNKPPEKDAPVVPEADKVEPKTPETPTDPPTGKIDFDKYGDEYTLSGGLSEASISELVDSGIPEIMVQNYVKGLDAIREATQAHAYSLVGGKDKYMAMIDFASTSLPKEEALAFNEAIVSDKRDEAIKGLYARYTEANPQFIEGGNSNAVVTNGFRTENEFKAALKDPRYKSDASYRDTVARKLASSKLIK